MKKILIAGVGGQSVRLVSHTLALTLQQLGFQVALLFDYDSAIRGGKSVAYLTYDREPIRNPIFDQADLLLKLADKEKGLVAEKTVCESGLCTDEEVPFGRLGVERFGRAIFGNMIALGRLMRLIDVDLAQVDLTPLLPRSLVEENLQAIHFGYQLNMFDD